MRHSTSGRARTGTRSRIHITPAALAAVAAILPARALAVERTWNNPAGGTFSQGSNWLGNVAPGPDDTASFRVNAQYTVNFSSSTNNLALLIFQGRPTFDLGGFTYTLTNSTDTVVVNAAVNESSSLTLRNGTLALPPAGGVIALARTDSSAASITLNNNARITGGATLFLGSVGSGGITVTSGSVSAREAILGNSRGSSGSVFISGTNSTWTTNLTIGGFGGGNGTFTARDGASVSSPQSLAVAMGRENQGDFTLADANTSFAGGTLNIAGGPGALATVNVLSGARFSHARGFVGQDKGALGILDIHTATWNSSDSFQTGAQGGSALIKVTDSRITTTGVILGTDAGGTTVARFTGPSTSWTNNGSLTVASAGDASLELAASTTRSTSGMVIAHAAGSAGRVTISDFGRLIVTGSPLTVGRAGSGSLTLKQFSSASAPAVEVGSFITADGALTVQGTGTTLGATTATFGADGRATVRITEGAIVSLTGSAALAANPGSFADILIAGAESALNASQVVVGGAAGPGGGKGGNATLTLGPGGRLVASTNVTLWSTGTINLDGGTLTAAGLVNNGGALNFNAGIVNLTGPTSPFNVATSGPLGPILQLRTGQTINATNQVTIQSSGLLRLEGGAFNVAGTFQNQGEIQLAHPTSRIGGNTILTNSGLITGDGHVQTRVNNQAGGEIRANAGQRVRFSGSVTNAGVINLLGGIAEFDGPLFVTGAGRITGRGTLLVASGATNNGQFQISAGLTDVHGNVDSTAGSRIIVTGQATATFFNNVTMAPGTEFRISSNSAAVFFGNVTGTAAANFTGAGAKYFESGASASLAVLDTPGATAVETGAGLTVGRVREASFTVNGNAAIRPGGGAPDGTSMVNQLIIGPNGTLDLADNALIVDYSPAQPSPIAGVRGDILRAYNGGGWDGPGLSSSTAKSTPGRALGYGESAQTLGPSGGSFAGLSVDGTAVLVRLTIPGDATLDGLVSFPDLVALAQNYNGTDKLWSQGDFNYDGNVTFPDLVLLAQNYNASLPAIPIPGAPANFDQDLSRALTQVPEPAFTSLFAALACGLANPRRRRT